MNFCGINFGILGMRVLSVNPRLNLNSLAYKGSVRSIYTRLNSCWLSGFGFTFV